VFWSTDAEVLVSPLANNVDVLVGGDGSFPKDQTQKQRGGVVRRNSETSSASMIQCVPPMCTWKDPSDLL